MIDTGLNRANIRGETQRDTASRRVPARPGRSGTDDDVQLTLTIPEGFGVYRDLDFDDADVHWRYTQNIILGRAE